MLNKLAFRNARRSAKDYIVYLLTMTVMAAMMFAFDSMALSDSVLSLCEEAAVMGWMIGIASAFIIGILAWLIRYMCRFMLEKRSREFGTYLLLGMNKKQVSRLYMKENLWMGALAFVLGLFAGAFLQQILMTVFYRVFSMDYPLHVEINGWSMLMTAIVYVLCYVFALFRSRKLFGKMTIADFMNMEKENEKMKDGRTGIAQFWLFAAVGYFIFYNIMLLRGRYTVWGVCLIVVGFIAAMYLFYYGLSAFFVQYVKKRRAGLYKPGRLFLIRQYVAKLKTMRFTMGTLTLLFTCAILGGTIAMMFARFQGAALDNSMPFDIIVYSGNPQDSFREEQTAIEEQCREADCSVEKSFVYQIYQDGSHVMNDYLYTHGDTIQKKYRSPDGSLNEEAVAEDGYEYFDYDTYMKLSDYNTLREMLGYDPVSLGENEYAIQMKSRLTRCMDEEILDRELTVPSGNLHLSDIYTINFSQNGNNGADYLLIVPDEAAASMTPYYASLAVMTRGEAPQQLQTILENIRLEKNGIPTQNEFYRLQEEGKIDEDLDWEPETMGGEGSDQIIVCIGNVLVRSEQGAELKMAMMSLVFPLAYIALVFLCVAFTILSVQQLSDSSKYRFRYDILSKMGLCRQEVDRMILKQLFFYYLVPMLVSVLLSAVTAVFAGNRFVFYTGAEGNGFYYFILSVFLFAGIYLIYFGVTYLGFTRNVHQEG